MFMYWLYMFFQLFTLTLNTKLLFFIKFRHSPTPHNFNYAKLLGITESVCSKRLELIVFLVVMFEIRLKCVYGWCITLTDDFDLWLLRSDSVLIGYFESNMNLQILYFCMERFELFFSLFTWCSSEINIISCSKKSTPIVLATNKGIFIYIARKARTTSDKKIYSVYIKFN